MNLRRAEAIAVYVVPAALLFGVIDWGLWHTPNALWGMYANQDGMWAAWNTVGILEWGRFLDLSPFNPLSGMGSQFIPNLPWLNPAAAVLALPLPRDLTYLISYTLYGIEIFISIVFLFRVLGLSQIRSSLGAQLYLLMLFPPIGATFQSLSWYSLAPVNAHLVALANFSLVMFLALGQDDSFKRNIACALGIMALAVVGLFSAPITFLTYAPVYGLILAFFLLWQCRNRRMIVWRLGTISVLLAILWLAGFVEYLGATAAMSARAAGFPPAFAAGIELLNPAYWLNVWHQFNLCTPAVQPLCNQYTMFYVHAAAICGALIQVWRNPPSLRILAVLFLIFIVSIEAYAFVEKVFLFGKLHTFSTPYIMWSAYTFFALFTVVFVFAPLDLFQHVYEKISKRYTSRNPRAAAILAPARSALLTGFPIFRLFMVGTIALVVPVWAYYLWITGVAPYQPPPPAYKQPIGWLGKSSIREPVIGPITSYLVVHASVHPGAPFRGYVTTYFGDPRGHIREAVKFTGRGMSSAVYADARFYFDEHYGNRLQEMDLWEFNIPSLEEYGQWVTKPVYNFINSLFSERDDGINPSFLRIYKLNLDWLAALGVRFLITDIRLDDAKADLRTVQHSPTAGPIYLYELRQVNLATYNPTHTIKVKTFRDATTAFKLNGNSLEENVVVFEDLAGPFQKAEKIELRMTRDGFRVLAESNGTSLIVLPVQFSKCLQIEPLESNAGAMKASLLRANGIQTLLKFVNKVDISVRFEFGLFGTAQCRSEDARDFARLGIE